MAEDLVLTIAPIIMAAVIAAVGFFLKEWRQKRNRNLRLTEQLNLARQQCDFFDAWLGMAEKYPKLNIGEETYSDMGVSLTRTRRDVDYAIRMAVHANKETVSRWGWLTLAGQAPTWHLKVVRFIYWAWLIVVVIFVVPLAISQTRPGESWYDTLVVNTAALLVFASPAFILRWYVRIRFRRATTGVG